MASSRPSSSTFLTKPPTSSLGRSASADLGKDRASTASSGSKRDRVSSLKEQHRPSGSSKSSSSKHKPSPSSKDKERGKKVKSPPSDRELARLKLKLIDSGSRFSRALSPTLPPSPPASRSPSPHLSSSNSSTPPTLSFTSYSDDPAGTSTKRSIPSPPSEEDGRSQGSSKRSRQSQEDDASTRRREKGAEEAEITSAKKALEAAAESRRRKRAQEHWGVDKYKSLQQTYNERARSLKHSAEGRQRNLPKEQNNGTSPASIMSLVEMTDAVLLWIYSFWCDERKSGQVTVPMWSSLDGMMRLVRESWEKVVKGAKAERAGVEAAKAMLGLSFLMDGIVQTHISASEMQRLHDRASRISSTALPPRAPSSTTSGPSPLHPATTQHLSADSPASLVSSGSSPNGSLSDSSHPTVPSDFLPQITSITRANARAIRTLTTAQQQLSMSVLMQEFPRSWARCVDAKLPSGGLDGTDKAVDPDWVEGGWAWPINQAGGGIGGTGGQMLPHLVVFGRSMLEEWVRKKLDEEREGSSRRLRDAGLGEGYFAVGGWRRS